LVLSNDHDENPLGEIVKVNLDRLLYAVDAPYEAYKAKDTVYCSEEQLAFGPLKAIEEDELCDVGTYTLLQAQKLEVFL
jgi:hypothetical protein